MGAARPPFYPPGREENSPKFWIKRQRFAANDKREER